MSLSIYILVIVTNIVVSTICLLNCSAKKKQTSDGPPAPSKSSQQAKENPKKINFASNMSATTVGTTTGGTSTYGKGNTTTGDVGDYESCPDMTPDELAKVQ